MTTTQDSFLKRFYIYQKERFPFIGYLFLVGAFSFSAISYSRMCRGAEGFIDILPFLVCVFNTVTLFFLVRVFDEFKDQEDDRLYRKYLPVPRGVISLVELKRVGIIVFILQILINAIFFPQMLLLYFFVILYLLLMGKEFFIPTWLKKHQFWYVTSHMFIIPFIDIFASGFDWHLNKIAPPQGLVIFFCISYANGIILEVGRKIKTPEKEETGVLSYTKLLGVKRAPMLWIGILIAALLLAIAGAWYANLGYIAYFVFVVLFIICVIPAVFFILKPSVKAAKFMDYFSALWTFGMYLTLGGIPMLLKLLGI